MPANWPARRKVDMKDDPILKGYAHLLELVDSQPWTKAGFRFGDIGAHSSRTIMLKELGLLLEDQKPSVSRKAYVSAVIEENCLGKRTVSTRKLTFQRLSELYGLDPSIILFRILRYLWQVDENGRPLLAILTALARDPLLRVKSTPILEMQHSEELVRQQFAEALRKSVENRFNESTLDKVVRNTSSSSSQSGHQTGRVRT